MSLKEKIRILGSVRVKAVPIWVILLISIGTAAGAFIWISNTISTGVTPSDRPIEIQGSFASSPYVGEVILQSFPYDINDNSQDVGYIVIEFWTTGGSDYIGPTNFSVDAYVMIGGGFTTVYVQNYTGYPANQGGYSVVYVLEALGGGGIDFGDMDSYTYGLIDVYITYYVTYYMTVKLHISSSPT